MNSNSTIIDVEQTDFQKHLDTLSQQTDITGYVARKALGHDNPEIFFQDLSNHGCICGMISGLIYYTDTHAFFEKHYDEIQGLKDEWEANVGQSLKIQGDIKNFLVWFAFEETAYQIASEWEVL